MIPTLQGTPADNRIVTTALRVDHTTDAGRVRALDCPGLTVESGTSVAIMGPSGCGKSTLLGLLAGLATPTLGRVSIGSVAVSELSDRARTGFRRTAVGMVYQSDNLLPHLTVEENVGLQRSIAAVSGGEATTTLLTALGLDTFAPRLPDQLSGGQRQRVAVARAVVHGPRVLLADEPTGALDPVNAVAVIDLLTRAQHALGATLVIVTHDPEIAARLDRTVHLTQPDPPSEVRDAG